MVVGCVIANRGIDRRSSNCKLIMDGVIHIREGIEKMELAQTAAQEVVERATESKEKNMEEKERRKEKETKERRKETETRRENERTSAESEYPLSRNKIRKMIKRLLKTDRRSRGRGRGREGEGPSGWRPLRVVARWPRRRGTPLWMAARRPRRS
ncbi:uncharacterized protein LOC143265757 [Megachile rotundata]|uniref:uncharacterized protein LOC143265757 n=1 Tax=Megachile rotundata TaxID=143995 RepID=UPI003FD0C25C